MSMVLQKKPEWSFYLLWILVTVVGIPFAFFIDLIIMRIVTGIVGDFIDVNGVRHITEDYLFMYPFVPLAGLLTGLLQYALLRRHFPHMGWWVPATVGGWLLGMFMIALAGWFGWGDAVTSLDLVFVVMGLSIGVVQWVFLRQRLPQAGWWIPANAAGWGLLALITSGNSIGQFGLLTLGLVPACITAALLALLVNQAHPSEPTET